MQNSQWKSAFLHLRIPFSFYLLPVFLFAISEIEVSNWSKAVYVFFILHILVYPASNGFNSYFDKDEGPIGGLKEPPPVNKTLYFISILLDIVALILSFFVSVAFMFMVLIYGLISKAYSHPITRWKSSPFGGWIAAGVFQGYFTFLMIVAGVSGFNSDTLLDLQIPAVLSSLLLLGSYPMTQIYQHEEDRNRGDRTISLLLGIRGTFIFTLCFFTFALTGFIVYFLTEFGIIKVILFLILTASIPLYFFFWFYKVWQDERLANFEYTMRLNFVSAFCFNLFFMVSIWLF